MWPAWKLPMTSTRRGGWCDRTRRWRTGVEVEGADEAVEERVAVEAGLAGEVGRRSSEDGGAEFVRGAVRDAEADLRPADDGDGDQVEGKQSATASSL